MSLNPFIFDQPVGSEDLIDREEDVQLLLDLAEGGHNSRLSAPRRYGKTTLVQAVMARAGDIGINTVYVNFYGILSVEEAAIRIEEAYRSSLQGPLRSWAVGVLRTLRPTISAPGTGVEITPEPESDVSRRLFSLLDMPVRMYKKSGSRTLVVFDEFQDVLRIKTSLDGIIRSRIELHNEEASYIFSGSHPGMMAELFGDRSRPFYGQARLVPLEPLADDDLAEYITQKFISTGKEVGLMIDPLLTTVRGHPQRAMFVAHHLWDSTKEGTEADEESWNSAIDAAYRAEEEGFETLWSGLRGSDHRVLAAVAARPSNLLEKRVLEKFGLARATAEDTVRRLVASGNLVGGDRGPEYVDPLLESWVARGRRGP